MPHPSKTYGIRFAEVRHMSLRSIMEGLISLLRPGEPEEPVEEPAPAAPEGTWTVYWLVFDGGRAAVGAPSEHPLKNYLPEGLSFKYGYVVADGVSREECKRMVDEIRPVKG
jgi:hypothetical protein